MHSKAGIGVFCMPVHARRTHPIGGMVRRAAALLLLTAVGLLACTTSELPRLPRSEAEMIRARSTAEAQFDAEIRSLIARNVAWVKTQYDAYAAGRRAAPPVVDILIISGGGDWGAFGAGVLKGWGQVKGPLARPAFSVVTGVSTGALIAPFAFLGDDASIDRIDTLYRNPRRDWFEPRWLLSFLTGGASYGDIPGLEREVRRALDRAMLQRLVAAGRGGRALVVNTSDIDFGEMHAWDLVAEAQRALATNDPGRVDRILLASSAVPGAFPPRQIDGDLYVDGGITSNVLYGGRITNEESFVAVWTRTYPGLPVPKTRYWVIFNNQFHPPPEVVQPNWKSVLPRSLTTATRAATVNGMRHLFALAEIYRLTSRADVEVRYIAVPDDWTPPKPGFFNKEVMNALADMGNRMGADPSSWRSDPP